MLSAGHGPLFSYSAANDAFFTGIDSQGVPFGILPEFTSGPATPLRLEPGDFFLLITDGFVEWANLKEEEFGQARLKHAIRDYAHLRLARLSLSLQPSLVFLKWDKADGRPDCRHHQAMLI